MLLWWLLLLGLWAGSLYALVAFGLVLTRAVRGFVNFAHAAVVVAAAYSTYAVMKWTEGGLSVGIAVGVLVGCGIALVSERLVFRLLYLKGTSPSGLMLVSLGLLIVVENVIALCFGDQRVAMPVDVQAVSVLGARLTVTQIVAIAASALLFVCLAALFQTRLGVRIRAVANDVDLAATCGLRVDHVILFATVISGMTGALAGILWALDNDLTPAMGFRPLLYGLVGAIVGGFRGMAGALLGGLFVGLIGCCALWILPTQWQDGIVFVILVAFLLLRPEGFFGRQGKKASV